jgi:ribonuclease D
MPLNYNPTGGRLTSLGYNEAMDSSELPPPVWIDTRADFLRMVADLGRFPSLSVDTESNSLHAYREQVCLIQFSTTQTDYLLDPIALPDLSALAPIFMNAAIEKIFHAAEYDLICLRRDFDFQFEHIFDTMVAARILGLPAVGLGALLESEFGLVVDKHYQRANWALRPLPAAQMAYAHQDTHYLLALRNNMETKLSEAGRLELAHEDFCRMTQAYNKCIPPEAEPVETFWRISGVQDLDPQQAAILKELSDYRERQAEYANQPVFKILSSDSLIAIAKAAPKTMRELEDLDLFGRRLLDRHGNGLVHAVERGLQNQPLYRSRSPRPDERFMQRLEALRVWRKAEAHTMGVESDVVLPKDLLFCLANNNPRTQEELADLLSSTPWRLEHYGEKILKALGVKAEA